MKIYHNPRCSKSRDSYNYLKDKNINLEVIEYLKTPFTKEDIQSILKKLKIEAKELIRKNETIFKDNFKNKELTENEWIDAMLKYPKLIERPIIVLGDRAVIGRPKENIDSLL